MTIKEFLANWGSLLVATAALIQPWCFLLWEKYVRKGRVSIHESGEIALGFSNIGPSIELHGTLKSENKDIFITKILLEVTRRKDNLKHDFCWLLFCGHKARTSNLEDVDIERASSFWIRKNDSHRYRIVFSDSETKQDIDRCIKEFNDSWNNILDLSDDADNTSHMTYQGFSSSPDHLKAFTSIDHMFYWEPGLYSIRFKVYLSNTNKPQSNEWEFMLTDQDSKELRLNVIRYLSSICLGENNFAIRYLDYRKCKTIIK